MLLFAGEHPTPLIVEFVNYYIGEPLYNFQINYTKPIWDKFFSNFGTDAETMFGVYSPENAVPWYTIMACILAVAVIGLLKGKLSGDDPQPGQMTLEAGYLAVANLVENVIGPHGMKYFPVIATFAVLAMLTGVGDGWPWGRDGLGQCHLRSRYRVVRLLQLRRH